MKRTTLKYALAAGCALAASLSQPTSAALPGQEKLAAPGLTQPVQILKDKWGISHIYAKNENDLFFAQGYNAARDRLFQMEMSRRRAEGTMAEILGPKEINRDIGARQFLYRGDLDQELTVYHPHGRAIFESFVKGINAYIDETVKNPNLLSPEFAMLGIKPQHWVLRDAVTRINSVSLGKPNGELQMLLAVHAAGADKVKDLEYFQPENPDLKVDPVVDAAIMNRSILDTYNAWVSSPKFTPDQLVAQYRGTQKAAQLNSRHLTDLAMVDETALPVGPPNPRTDMGSNNWLVSGKLTMSGFPIVVGDPHRAQDTPNLRYWVHLNAPGWNVIGAGQATQPGVSIGHNDYGAWELTAFGTNDEDLVVYDTNPANPNQYKYGNGWEDMKVINDTIAVKGQAPRKVAVKFTRHGPVVSEDTVHHKAYAVHATYLEAGGAPYVASLRMDQAKSAAEYMDAASYMYYPAETYSWGDRDGHSLDTATGMTPLRPNSAGLMPGPGDGRYEWAGYLPIKDLPHILNPEKGYYATSNEFQIPTGKMETSWPDKRALHYSWTDPYRAQVETEFLSSGRRFTVADMEQLQTSDMSIPARSIVPLLKDVTIPNPASNEAAQRLLHWNYILDKNSVEAGIYEMFQSHLMLNVRATVVPEAARGSLTVPMIRIVSLLNAPDGSFGANPTAGRDAILIKSLDQAVADLTQKFGADMSKWNLGAYHYATIMHPMAAAVTPELAAKLNVGNMPRGGDAYTVTATGGPGNQTGGGSFKNIFDTENWDNSVGEDNPGQSGDIRDPHYGDLYEYWARGKYFPVFFSRAKIESVTEHDLQLAP